MAKVKSDDTFLVNRNDITYSVETQDLMAKIKDDDYMVVNRGDVAYKVTGAEVIDSLIPELKINSVTLSTNEPRENYEILCIVDYEGGTNPAVITYQWGYYDGTTETDITGEGANTRVYIPSTVVVGKYLYCKVTVTDTQPKTVSGQSPYTNAVVTEDTFPPAISTVTVVDDNPGIGSRFENKTFDARAELATDGKPLSTKTFVATVNGSLEQAIQTSPISTTTTETIPGDWTNGPWIAGDEFAVPSYRMWETNTPGNYVVASTGSTPMYSINYGETWSPSTLVSPATGGCRAVCYSKELNRVVGVGWQGSLATSILYSDDEGKSYQPCPGGPPIGQGVEYVNYGYGTNGEPLFVAGGGYNSGYSRQWSSNDGLNWVPTNLPTPGTGQAWPPWIQDVLYSNGRWVLCAWGENGVSAGNGICDFWYSANGVSWTPANSRHGLYAGKYNVATDGKGTWVIPNGNWGCLTSKDNAVNWTNYSVAGGYLQWVNWCGDKFIMTVPDNQSADSVWWSEDGINWTASVGLGEMSDGKARGYSSVNYLNRKIFLGGQRADNHIPSDAPANSVKSTSLTGTGFDKDITRVTFQDDTNLKYLLEGDSITGDTSGTDATIRDVNLDSNSIDCTDLITTWQIGETVTGPVRKIDTASKYVEFNSSGVVTGLSDDPMSPAYTTTDINPTLTLTFSQYIDGQETDVVLPANTTLSVCVTAENSVGASGPICGAVTPVAVTSGGGNPFVAPATPVSVSGYYPLYETEADANAAGDGTSHTHIFNGVTYYMPNPITIYHGDYGY